ANVHAIAVVADGAGNAANLASSFQHDRVNVGMPLQLQGCSQTGRSGANNDRGFTHNFQLNGTVKITVIVSYSFDKRQCFIRSPFHKMRFPDVEPRLEITDTEL